MEIKITTSLLNNFVDATEEMREDKQWFLLYCIVTISSLIRDIAE